MEVKKGRDPQNSRCLTTAVPVKLVFLKISRFVEGIMIHHVSLKNRLRIAIASLFHVFMSRLDSFCRTKAFGSAGC